MRASWFKSLVAVGVSLAASAQAHAQPLFAHAESIECTAANADLVFVGTLSEFDGKGRADARGSREGTIDVEDVLKEDIFTAEPYRRLRVHLPYPASTLADWKDHSHRLLVALKEDVPDATSVIDLADERLEVLTADFTLLRDPAAVTRIARETVRRVPAAVRRLHTFGLAVPREAVAGTRWGKYYETGGHLVLSVPADERLEKRAHDYLRSAVYQRREEGVQALRYFKSAENVARVRVLLDDPGWAYLRHAQENGGIEVRIYGVRREAYRTLKSWGVDAEEPMTLEEVRK